MKLTAIMTFHIITTFPEMFDSYLNESILKRAQKNKLIKIKFYNPRDFAKDSHKTTDDSPYGGGPGMVMAAPPLLAAAQKAKRSTKSGKTKIIILSPRGKQFTNTYASRLAKSYKHIILIAGRYEGIDARVKKALKADSSLQGKAEVEEISVGPYTLTGGEVPAMAVLDAVSRHIPKVLGKGESLEEKRVASGEVYTRPEEIKHGGKKYKVPKVLLSGDHKKIEKWKKGRS